MKKYDEQLMKFTITNDKLKMEIPLKELVWLFHNSPNNVSDGEGLAYKIIKNKTQEFAEFIVRNLMDIDGYNDDVVLWGIPFEKVFERIYEDDLDFIIYPEDY